MRRTALRQAAVSNWRHLRSEVMAAADAVRYNPDPGAAPPPRAERLAAGGIAGLVLIGAVGTYPAVVGGVAPATGTPATRPALAPVPTVAPTPSQSPSPSPTPSPTPLADTDGPGVSEHTAERNRQ